MVVARRSRHSGLDKVADVGGEEFDIAPAGGVAGVGNQRRDQLVRHRARERGRLDVRQEP
jgi:hypothetical protein